MILKIRNSFFARFFWGFFALYVLNCSVDAPDLYEEHIAEDLSFNEQESMVEVLVEKILGFEDAIAEYDDCDENQEMVLDQDISFKYCSGIEHAYEVPAYVNFLPKKRFLTFQYLVSSRFIEVLSPPPEV